MGRSPCCSREGLNKGAWTPLEDKTLTDFITTHGEGKWRSLPKRAGLKRCGKSCRLRWLNYLRPDIKRGNITADEEDLIIRLHKLLGNRWSLIAGRLPGRTDNEIKNYWNTNIGRRIQLQAALKYTSNGGNNIHSPLFQSKSTKKNSSSSSSSIVVRSKASRCSKTFINSDQQQQQHQLDSTPAAAPAQAVEAAAPPPPASTDDLNPLNLQLTDDQSFDFHESMANDDFFMMDDNDNFLSNLFDNDLFMPPPRFDYSNAIGHNAFDTEAASSSSNPCGVLHADESFDGMFHGAQLGSMNMMSLFDTICTTNLDWIQD